jgi:hypothetical protein
VLADAVREAGAVVIKDVKFIEHMQRRDLTRWRKNFRARVAAMRALLAHSVEDSTPTPRGEGDE